MSSRFRKLVKRALLWKCPACGRGDLFRGLLLMQPRCASCGLPFQPEPGFYLGSIYINYGLTALITTTIYVGLLLTQGPPGRATQVSLLAFAVIFPVLMHRHARSLWLGFDQWLDPRGQEE